MQRDLCWELLIELTFPSAPGNGEATAQATCDLQGGGFYFSINVYRFKDFICPWTASPSFLIPTASRYDVILFQLPTFVQQPFITLSSWCRVPACASDRLSGPRTWAVGWQAWQEGWGRRKEAGRGRGWGDGARAVPGCSPGAPPAHRPARLLLPRGEEVAGCSCGQVLVAVPWNRVTWVGCSPPRSVNSEQSGQKGAFCSSYPITPLSHVPSGTKAQVVSFSITSCFHLLLEWGKTMNKMPSRLWWPFLWTLVQVRTKHRAAPLLRQSPTREKATQRRARPWEHLSPCWLFLPNTQ